MPYQLISFDLCPFVQRSVITLKKKQVDFDISYIDLAKPPDWFLAISPLGKVPVLRVDDTVLFESAVINEYLDEVNPPPYHPQEPLRRAHNRAWIEFGSHLINRQYRLLTVVDRGVFDKELEELKEDLRHLEGQLTTGPFFNGGAFSLVDAAYAPLFMRFAIMERHHPLSLFDEFPHLSSWSDVLLALPAVQESVVPDFEARFNRYFSALGSCFGRYLSA